MSADRDNEVCAPLINALSFQMTASLFEEIQKFSAEHGETVAVSIALDAVLMSAASLLKTAVSNRMVRTTMPYQAVLHSRLDELLAMEFRVHSMRPDGSFEPTGQPIN
ncbi:hypothetical protein [Bosea minatitlanensis]|uniref:Uncharacterized protein n=1 Tax=Bosea minatitlanensis TaxID=128782 RepID=A0ABW0F1G3_9HYPH|nr:hypothetical protein [Bosea minatitlanensis]MCT4491775.1 hypothetical protein [Bosea minatitlanensis]